MKKILISIAAIVISLIFSSCIFIGPSIKGNGNVVEENRTVDDFSQIKASKGTNVYISQGEFKEVRVKADENLVDIIRTKVEDGVLIITNTQQIKKATSNKVFVTVKKIERISAFAGSNVYSETKLESPQMELSCSAGSNMKLDLNVGQAEVSTTAGSNVYLEGNVENMDATASAGSNIKAEELTVKNCKAKANSGANIWITVEVELEGKASSGANVFYYGNPVNLNVSSSSGGNVKKR